MTKPCDIFILSIDQRSARLQHFATCIPADSHFKTYFPTITMAKGRRPGKSMKAQGPSRKASNALGYAKRQTLKSKTLSVGALSDVYEFQQQKVRRSKVKLQFEKDEMVGGMGSGSEDEEDGNTRKRNEMRPRLVGENDDNDRIGEDEDEEIDSDEAFEDSDEERFAGFNFSHKRDARQNLKSKKSSQYKAKGSKSVRFAEVDLNEDSDVEDAAISSQSEHEDEGDDDEGEEEEAGDADEFIDVLDIMDGRGEPDSGDDRGKVVRENGVPEKEMKDAEETLQTLEDEDDEMDGLSGDDEQCESEAEEDDPHEGISASEAEDEENPSALQDLESFVTGLDAGQKRKAPDDDDETAQQGADVARARKRRILQEKSEAGAENEFAAHLGQSSNLLSLKKSAKVLASTSGKNKTLAAPLPQRTAERLDREAAYEQTKEEVDKWKAAMQRIKEAEHLSFPLQTKPTTRTSNLELAAKFKPTTELESAVDRLLKSAKMRDEDIAHTESLKMNNLSVEEVAARRAELAKMRELMFRAEAKAKRVAKIKSKTYRRLKKKEHARLAAKLGEDDENEDDEEGRLRREFERAKERATLRHKNTGKWAKAMKARGELDEDQRQEISEMLDRGERLRKKIRGEGESGDEESDDETSGDDGVGTIERIKAKAFEELAGLDDGEPAAESGNKNKSIFEMKFMKDAMARNRRRVAEEIDDFVKELGPALEDASCDVQLEVVESYGTSIERVGGRMTYRPGGASGALKPSTSLASDTSSVTLKSTDFFPDTHAESPLSPLSSPVPKRTDPLSPLSPTEESNPWLAQAASSTRALQTKHEVLVSKSSVSTEKSKNKLRKRGKKREEEKEKAKDDATVDISMSNVMTLGNSSAGSSKETESKPSANHPTTLKPRQKDDESDSDQNSEVEEQERGINRKGKGKASGVKAFEQRDLVARAFAGDDVVRDFAEQKRRETQEDAPREIDTTLPGWGSWGGAGTKKAPPKPFLIKKVAGVDPTFRADYKKAHVIISEKRDKKAAKYMVKDLPFPYTSKAQFERSMETPLGTEWNTRLGFQRATLPRVVKKMGALISPLEKLQ
ncbi:Uncharacterized protein C57A7.06 [Grifola frondosa]|uniref:Uncharacterized protein C57A7.06 n=1 Tax=Grifola frondosa TaxID=5627 RepID=A0A1C7MSK3_GRIFR|nr:Uncharacterized protein C57A7.06 [Grifola frondosa]